MTPARELSRPASLRLRLAGRGGDAYLDGRERIPRAEPCRSAIEFSPLPEKRGGRGWGRGAPLARANEFAATTTRRPPSRTGGPCGTVKSVPRGGLGACRHAREPRPRDRILPSPRGTRGEGPGGGPVGRSSISFAAPQSLRSTNLPQQFWGRWRAWASRRGARGRSAIHPPRGRILPSPRGTSGEGPGEGRCRAQLDFVRRAPISPIHQPPPAVLGEVASLGEPEGALADAA
jgi:hypothetical protein